MTETVAFTFFSVEYKTVSLNTCGFETSRSNREIEFSESIFVDIFIVNRIREMVSFELGKEMKKGVFRLVTSVRQRRNFESP